MTTEEVDGQVGGQHVLKPPPLHPIPTRVDCRQRVLFTALAVLAAETELMGETPDAHASDAVEYAWEQLELACRDLAESVDRTADDIGVPVGWRRMTCSVCDQLGHTRAHFDHQRRKA